MSLYLVINMLVLSVPFALSFDQKVHFFTRWRSLVPSLIITMALFTFWDVIFTNKEVWGFNSRYHGRWVLFGLPVEEILFFITIPYASLFTIYVLKAYFPKFRLNGNQVRIVSFFLILTLSVLAILNIERRYTAAVFLISAALIAWILIFNKEILRQFYVSYIVILVPFMVVNGILTGSFIEGQVVWYNDLENLGIRIWTIPVEDIFYGMSLVLINYYLTETIGNRRRMPQPVNG